ncbi:hypothetical protein [Brachybacterium sp. J153]|uniref:hypothetical protein n=1 Tax=Brachybacterium sp. J153 TaxID=3116488 RepID=UPI002E760FDE|nr:hypothetical protein [Brachybacterium sp. J153]MEE1617318.1 hypothetical protein [Brachybacterium sp. J153]
MKATKHGVWDFTEDEWAAIDKAVRNVYFNNISRLPAHWQGTPSDPAGELRSWTYEYAATHAQEIHERAHTPPFITRLLSKRLQQYLNRHTEKRPEVPFGIGSTFDRNVLDALGGPGSPVIAPAERDPYADALEPYKRLLTPARRRRLWELMNPGETKTTNYLDPTGEKATEHVYLEHLQKILDTQLFHPGNHCKCGECVNMIRLAA